MKTWQEVGGYFKQDRGRKRIAQEPPRHEICEGCDTPVTWGTLHNVLVDPTLTLGERNGKPVYRFEAFKALCARCRRSR